ncbi:MAG: histidine kinase [Firmicutes bacterium]|nr:histidine kinase [Bacillota bacterium]
MYSSQEVLIINKDELVLSHSDDSILSSNIIAAEGKISATDLNPFIGDIKNNLFSNKSGILELKFKGKDLIVLFNTIDISNWKLLSIVDKAEMLSTFNTIKKYIMIASFMALILGAIFIIIITGIIYKPISILKSAMQKAREGKFDVCITDKRKDEFRELYESFNSMIETIDKLINELYEKKLLAAEAELKALQANINPHFIYNIFESMIWMIELGNMDDLKKMVISLSKFYRLVLSEGKDIITVKEVAEQIENYITIQKIRYKDRLYVNINIDNKLYDYEMLNILLQPIIKNAIIHGIQGKSGPGCIKINGYMEANDIMVFTVEDDGIGIQEDKLEEIKKNLIDFSNSKNTKDAYYALKNINQRIKLHYGGEFGINIESTYNKGTKVILKIPTNKSAKKKIYQEAV